MWRDRTNLYISYRQSYSHHPTNRKPRFGGPASNGFSDNGGVDDERRGLMSAGAFEDDGDAVIEMDLLPPRWLDIQDRVTEYLEEITKQTRRLEQLHQKHVLPGFDDEDVKKREEREIERLTQEITRGFQSCKKAIKTIESMVHESKQQGNISKAEETMATNLKISLATRVGDVSSLFRKKQSTYLKKLKALGGMGTPNPLSRTSTPAQNPYTDPSMEELETDRSLGQSTLLQTTMKRTTNSNEARITQREREIEEIAQGIIELANIFQDLNAMVVEQGSMLDRIDVNIEVMSEDVKQAHKELTVATSYQKRGVKRKAMLLLIILIAGAFILLSIKLGTKSSSPPEAPQPAPPEEDAQTVRARAPDLASPSSVELHTKRRKDWHRRKRRIWL